MSSRELDIVLFGASGVTGLYVVEELHRSSEGLRWGVAGRNSDKLRSTLREAAKNLGLEECDYGYHLGACSGTSKSNYKAMADAAKRSWKCQTCVILAARGPPKVTRQARNEQSLSEKMLIEKKKLNELPEIKQKQDVLFQVKETVEGMEKSVQHLSD
ncbi:hypothetical protein HPB51_017666 [Rhipicephalus microplus]|uniref:Uncharacterized protein n=1 Tax=Rhipicephalus microplus TaxID=6941 RepID=A0A9J6E2J2_RHIMP|nr:hypothetical protein HPB51_017666 [Rhipicephalus microplus]